MSTPTPAKKVSSFSYGVEPTPMPADYSHPHRPGAAQALADAQRRVAAASKGTTRPATAWWRSSTTPQWTSGT